MFRSTTTVARLSTIAGACMVVLISLWPHGASGESKASPRARYSATEDATSHLRFTPVNLSNGSTLTFISPNQWSEAASLLIEVLNNTHEHFTDLFVDIPSFSTSVRLMEEEEFFSLTSAPRWTNAMFFRGQIILPLSVRQPVDFENLQRSLRHEYTHAILAALSAGHLPGWIDEGLAQWFEGSENPGLRTALREWLKTHEAVPLSLLQGGFTKLPAEMVPAAYAQSLLASRLLTEKYGFKAMANYFLLLREGVDKDTGFETAFGISTKDFEAQLARALKKWAARPDVIPPTSQVREGAHAHSSGEHH